MEPKITQWKGTSSEPSSLPGSFPPGATVTGHFVAPVPVGEPIFDTLRLPGYGKTYRKPAQPTNGWWSHLFFWVKPSWKTNIYPIYVLKIDGWFRWFISFSNGPIFQLGYSSPIWGTRFLSCRSRVIGAHPTISHCQAFGPRWPRCVWVWYPRKVWICHRLFDRNHFFDNNFQKTRVLF